MDMLVETVPNCGAKPDETVKEFYAPDAAYSMRTMPYSNRHNAAQKQCTTYNATCHWPSQKLQSPPRGLPKASTPAGEWRRWLDSRIVNAPNSHLNRLATPSEPEAEPEAEAQPEV